MPSHGLLVSVGRFQEKHRQKYITEMKLTLYVGCEVVIRSWLLHFSYKPWFHGLPSFHRHPSRALLLGHQVDPLSSSARRYSHSRGTPPIDQPSRHTQSKKRRVTRYCCRGTPRRRGRGTITATTTTVTTTATRWCIYYSRDGASWAVVRHSSTTVWKCESKN